MRPARIYPWRKMHRSRAPSIAPGTFFVAQSWADCITTMPGFDLRQAFRVSNGRFAPIALKNSKIAGLRKSRKCSALAISAAARRCRIDTRASDRFCGNSCGPSTRSKGNAPAVLRIFGHQRKRTFSTQSRAKRTSQLRNQTSEFDPGCSLIPGLRSRLSKHFLAGFMVLSAVGACPPHDGVR
jgi:hypothetical protein